jgi:hypothetical protein
MRYLFISLHNREPDFYGRVGAELERLGHETRHVTFSRAATRLQRERGLVSYCLQDVISALPPLGDLAAEVERIEGEYELVGIRDVYRADRAAERLPEERALRRTVDHFRALERIFDETRPDVLVPEVGNETIRVAGHHIGLRRGIPVLFLLYTIFPNPLRLYVDTLHAPIVPPEELRELTPEEVEEVEAFRRSFTERAKPIREYRRWRLERRRVGIFAGHVRRKLVDDRDNDYLHPLGLLWTNVSETARAKAVRPFYDGLDPERPFVYFPLHVTDDYKIKKIIPHCVDQAAIVEQIADALPVGYDLVLKEHPMSVGRNSAALLRRLRKRRNVRLVEPHTSTHELIRRSEAVAVISSTVGLEALLYEKPVLTLGEPFYGGYGITLDLDSFAGIREGVPALLRFRPDPDRIRSFLHAAMQRCYPGAPMLVDNSDENARRLAGTLAEVGTRVVESRRALAAGA